MSTTVRGHPVRGSPAGQPIMAALDLFGRRWVLRILWELTDQPLGFRALQQACDGMSSSVLASRLADLTAARLVDANARGEYLLAASPGSCSSPWARCGSGRRNGPSWQRGRPGAGAPGQEAGPEAP